MSPRAVAGVAVIVLWALLGASASEGASAEIGPEADLCAEINGLGPGDELVLRAGAYAGPCTIRQGGGPGAPTVIRAKDLADRPRLVHGGATANVLDIRADHVTIRGLALGPTQSGVDGVRIHSRGGVTVEECEFTGLGGIAVVANSASGRGLVVRRNVIRNSGATAMYFGCHDGAFCALADLLVERNYIHTVRAPDPEIGYGIQVKLNSVAVIRDNVIADTKGPGIMVYGARDVTAVSVVERNFVTGSLGSSGIVVGGGPAIVRNNIALASREAGIALEDYGRRGLLRGIAVTHNTVAGNRGGGIVAPDSGLRDTAVINNAASGWVAPLPGAQVGLRLAGNVDCSLRACFASSEILDFSPLAAGGLVAAGVVRGDPWAPADDYFGARRGLPPTVGAIERAGGPIVIGPRP